MLPTPTIRPRTAEIPSCCASGLNQGTFHLAVAGLKQSIRDQPTDRDCARHPGAWGQRLSAIGKGWSRLHLTLRLNTGAGIVENNHSRSKVHFRPRLKTHNDVRTCAPTTLHSLCELPLGKPAWIFGVK